MRDKIIDIQARSMRDNLLFFNMPELEKENTTEMIHKLLESNIGITDARNAVKIDRSITQNWQKERQRSKAKTNSGKIQLSSRPGICATQCKKAERNKNRNIRAVSRRN